MKVVGLTGKICSGKSYIAALLEKKGARTIDYDVLSKSVLDSEIDSVSKLLGCEKTHESVADAIFSDPAKRTRLEDFLYAKLREITEREIKNYRGEVLVLNAPLLSRAHLDSYCDAVIFVDAPLEVRKERFLRERKGGEAEFERREASQRDVSVSEIDKTAKVLILKNDGFISVDSDLESAMREIIYG